MEVIGGIEIWKDIKGYEGMYQVSTQGNLKSLDRIVNHPKSIKLTLKGGVIKSSVNGSGYKIVQLNKNGKGVIYLVHRLVSGAYLNNPDNKPQVNHIDGNKANNLLENLEWVTRSENMIHAYENNLNHKGENHYKSKLSKTRVSAIKRLLRINPNVNKYSLAKKVGVTNGVIYQIINNTTWKHVS